MSDTDSKSREIGQEFEVTEYTSGILDLELARHFEKAFPQRKSEFFLDGIKKIDGEHSRVYVLLVGGEIRGATFAYRIFVDSSRVLWAPSYWFVDQKFRSYGLNFFMCFKTALGGKLVDVSPTSPVKKLLTGLKFREINYGSVMVPVLLFLCLRNCSVNNIDVSSMHCPVERFRDRRDLFWFKVRYEARESNLCIKRSSRFGVTFFIAVYFCKEDWPTLLPSLIRKLCLLFPFSILIYPKLSKDKEHFPRFASRKFHSFSNVSERESTYSILGSEVTEII